MLELSTPNVILCMGHLHARLRTNIYGRQWAQGTIFFSRMTPAKWGGHERHRLCYNCSKKALRLSFIYFILWNYVLFKVFFNYSFDLYLCAFKVHRKTVYCCSRVGKRCMTACILSVASSCGWIESGQSVWSFYTRTLKPWTSGNFIKWSDLQFYINVVK